MINNIKVKIFHFLLMGLFVITLQPKNLHGYIADRAYVVDGGGSNVKVVDTTTNTIVTSIPVGSFPVAIALSPIADIAYVANSFGNSVTVIDTLNNTVITTISLPATQPLSVAFAPDGLTVLVALSSSNTIQVVDATTHTPLTTFAAGVYPDWIAFTPDGSKIFVTNQSSNNVTVYDSSYNLLTTIGVGTGPFYIAITPDGTKGYVANSTSSNYSIIDTVSNTLIGTYSFFSVQNSPQNVAISPDGTSVYISSSAGGILQHIDVLTNVVSNVTGAPNGRGLAFNQSGSTLYYAESTELGTVDPLTNIFTAGVVTGFSFPYRLAFYPAPVVPSGPLPPSNFIGKPGKDRFVTQTDYINYLSWMNSPSDDIVSYVLSRNGVEIATILSLQTDPTRPGSYSYADHNRRKNVPYVYSLVAVSGTGSTSAPVTITVP